VRLPAAAWGEKDGTVTNSERMVSRQRTFLPQLGEAKPDWWIVSQVAQRMGWRDAFSYDRASQIWREHAGLSTYENTGERLFALPHQTGSGNAAYEAMEPFRWGERPFADGRFPTPDGRARLVTVHQMPLREEVKRWPLILNTGRYRDQWHTMTRTGLSPRLARHREEPLVEIHPRDAAAAGVTDGGLARVITGFGDSLFRVCVSDSQRPGEVFAPIHWTDQQSTGGRTGKLAWPLTDTISGQPGFKSTPARVELQPVDWRGFMIVHGEPGKKLDCLWATRVTVPNGSLYELAGTGDPAHVAGFLPKGDVIEAADPGHGTWRVAVLQEGRLAAVLFLTQTGELASREWLIEQLRQPQGPAVLAGRAPGAQPDKGAVVCVCFDVGTKTILRAIADRRLTSVAEVGAVLRAGTNCGSCRPAISRLLEQQGRPLHAA
jgi:assimilatory nitrate reductase catalytic subunit